MTRKARKPVQTATHRHFADCTVKFTKTKDFLGGELYRIVFKSGEVSTMSANRFNELFAVN